MAHLIEVCHNYAFFIAAYFMTLLHNNYTGILQVHDVATPVVSNVFDGSGELIVGVASVRAVVRFLQHTMYC
jgi:hypothetical protein